jgi:hypothetical protein
MQDINHQSRNPRGSSPPFQELERWIEDGANGSHWVKTLAVGSQALVGRVMASLDLEPDALRQDMDRGRWEDDGGT